MPSIFSKIVSGEIPCHKITESENFIAFLDIQPLKKGHTLIVPKQEIDYIFDINDASLAEMMQLSKKVATALKKAFPCTKVGVAVLGLEVPHAHLHLVPIDQESDIRFSNPRLKFSEAEYREIATAITKYL